MGGGPGDYSWRLWAYETAWRGELADEFEAQQELRMVAASSERQGDRQFFELAHTDGIMPIVRATARFNEHRPLIRALFKAPAGATRLVPFECRRIGQSTKTNVSC